MNHQTTTQSFSFKLIIHFFQINPIYNFIPIWYELLTFYQINFYEDFWNERLWKTHFFYHKIANAEDKISFNFCNFPVSFCSFFAWKITNSKSLVKVIFANQKPIRGFFKLPFPVLNSSQWFISHYFPITYFSHHKYLREINYQLIVIFPKIFSYDFFVDWVKP